MTDRIAIISDIHGNLTALERVLEEIQERGIRRIICLGDLIGKGPRPAACTDKVLSVCESVVKGNWDHLATTWANRSFMQWHLRQLGQARIEALYNLPVYKEFRMSGRLVRLCHASPHDLFHRVFQHTDAHERMRLFAPTPTWDEPADVLGYGDIHGAYIEHFQGEHKGKVIFNAGSVGNPLEIPQACYAILEGVEHGTEPASFSITLARTPYDVEAEIRVAEATSMPHVKEYVEELRTGRYGRRDFQ
jgi:protein phosphatase